MTTQTSQHCYRQAQPKHNEARWLRLCLSAGLLSLASFGHGDNHRPGAGEYEVTTTSNFNNLPVTVTTTNCITAEDLDQDPASVFADTAAAENCELEEFEMADGIMSMHMVCNSDEGGLEMTTEGAYTESSYSMNSTIVISAGETRMTTTATVAGTRVGDCE